MEGIYFLGLFSSKPLLLCIYYNISFGDCKKKNRVAVVLQLLKISVKSFQLHIIIIVGFRSEQCIFFKQKFKIVTVVALLTCYADLFTAQYTAGYMYVYCGIRMSYISLCAVFQTSDNRRRRRSFVIVIIIIFIVQSKVPRDDGFL